MFSFGKLMPPKFFWDMEGRKCDFTRKRMFKEKISIFRKIIASLVSILKYSTGILLTRVSKLRVCFVSCTKGNLLEHANRLSIGDL